MKRFLHPTEAVLAVFLASAPVHAEGDHGGHARAGRLEEAREDRAGHDDGSRRQDAVCTRRGMMNPPLKGRSSWSRRH